MPDVEEKKMFGGITFMVDGKMCVNVGDNEIMCRIDPELYAICLEKSGCRPVIMKGRKYTGYVCVNEHAIKTKNQLNYWISLALDFNKRAKASKKRVKKIS